MKTIILPGFSVHNKEWADELANNFKLITNSKVVVHNWLHWNNGKSSLSLKEELNNIIKEVGEEKVNIIAKSVGTMVAMHLLKVIPNKIEKIILCGIPSVSQERKKLFTTPLSVFNPKNIVVFQNTKDPFVSYEEVKQFMKKINSKIKVFKKERSDHNYPYFADFNYFFK
jgi:predicted alpha/beta hydrolase family esterase